MCNKPDFIDDDLTDFLGRDCAPVSDEHANMVFDHLAAARHEPRSGQERYEEPCKKCKGSGKFRSYTGRVVGDCFTCKGTGMLVFKTSPEQRAQNAESRQLAKKAKKKAKLDAWIAEHAGEWEWLLAASANANSFAISLLEGLSKFGSLTDGQTQAIRRGMAKDEERERETAEIANRAPDIAADQLAKLGNAFASAIEQHIKYPKLRLDAYIFSIVRSGQNEGSIYVKRDEKDENGEREYLGKITEGRFFRAFKCTDEDEQRILAAANDPQAAAIAYGRKLGKCSVCGRGLTKHVSIERGIGPICAERFGW